MPTFTVNTTSDVVNPGDSLLSLREAVQQANATARADVIQFAASVQGHTLTLTGGELVLTRDVAIHGGGVTLDGNDTDPDPRDAAGHRIFNITGSGTDVSLDNLTLTRGSVDDADGGKGGAILLGGGSLTMAGCTVTDNTSTADYRDSGLYTEGGGIYARAGSRLTMTGCTITDNYSGGHYAGNGGGISAKNASITIRDSQLSGNEAYYGGGAILLIGGSLTIENCSIKQNSENISFDEGYGGALQIGNADVVISRSTISNNQAEYGGGIFSYACHITIDDSTIANNTAYDGGALSARGDGSLIIRNSTITGNHTVSGSAIASDVDLANSIVAGNTATFFVSNPDVYGTITSSDGHNIFGSDIGANPAGDRESIAASTIFAAIDPATGGGLLNANGVVPLRNALDNPALSGGDPLAADATDQLGTARPLPAGSLPDIGSVEINPALSTGATANNDVRTGNGSDNSLSGLAGNDYLKGLGGKDDLSGGANSDLLDGGAANDTLNGGTGTDFALFGGSTGVVIDLSLANDTAKRGSETDKLISIEGAIGSSANDTFKGDGNANWFQGGLGKDTATGGGGRDLYDFNTVSESAAGSNRDVITDFAHLADKFDLMGIDADTTVAANQAFHWVGTAPLSGPGELGFHVTSAGNTIVRASNDADAANELEVQLNGSVTLTHLDFYM